MEPGDLDALIGDIRREAARRRASPDFPVDEEAAISVELGEVGPRRPGPDLDAVVARLRQIAGANPSSDQAGDLGEMAELLASSVRALALRLHHLEGRLTPRSGATVPAGPVSPGIGPLPVPLPGAEPSLDAAVSAALPPAGRILVAGPGAIPWAEALTARGADVYALDPRGPEFNGSGAARSGPVLDHLLDIGAGALAAVVRLGGLTPAELAVLEAEAAELARVSITVVVASIAPWWWRRSTGVAPIGDPRPAEAETWIDILAGTGLTATARYSDSGRTYLVTAGHPGVSP